MTCEGCGLVEQLELPAYVTRSLCVPCFERWQSLPPLPPGPGAEVILEHLAPGLPWRDYVELRPEPLAAPECHVVDHTGHDVLGEYCFDCGTLFLPLDSRPD